MTADGPEVCGSWRVVHFDHGDAAEIRWCDRTDGPCPYPGTPQSPVNPNGDDATDRLCATSGARRFRVHYADSVIAAARDRWLEAVRRDRLDNAGLDPDTISVVTAALDFVTSTEPTTETDR